MRCYSSEESLPVCKMGLAERLIYRAPERERLVVGRMLTSRAQRQPCCPWGGVGAFWWLGGGHEGWEAPPSPPLLESDTVQE